MLSAHVVAVFALLSIAAVLAATSLVTDSITFDETSHLTAGYSYLRTADFRLAPDHPPLAKLWCAWPLLLMDVRWPAGDHPEWRSGNVFAFGRHFLCDLNDAQRLMLVGRGMMVVLLLATCATVYVAARWLFGRPAGLLALAVSAFSPELLAHGRLVTTDLPIALCSLLVLLTFARLVQSPTWLRLVATAAALGAASVTKMSWPLVIPALVVMGVLTARRRAACSSADRSARGERTCQELARLLMLWVALALTTWLSIWCCYGWRNEILALPGGDADEPHATAALQAAADKVAERWQIALADPETRHPRRGVVAAALQFAAGHRLLPEAYLLGMAQTLESTSLRPAYLCGEYSNTGWRSYFPVAFAIKTPVGTMLLILAGGAALLLRKRSASDGILLWGLLAFGVTYGGYVTASPLNIGHRHLLPLYGVLYVFSGAAASWWTSRPGRVLVGGALAWLIAANLYIHPQYLSYFNELIGGPRRGHRYLADSNIDWGQDLLRLAAYARQHPQEQIKLAYFGSAVPREYLACEALPSFHPVLPPASLTAGTYVVSVTQLLGVYDPEIRAGFWDERSRSAYRTLGMLAAAPPAENASAEALAQHAEAVREFDELRRKRLVCRLAQRPPDERVGHSLFVYHLTEADVARLTEP